MCKGALKFWAIQYMDGVCQKHTKDTKKTLFKTSKAHRLDQSNEHQVL